MCLLQPLLVQPEFPWDLWHDLSPHKSTDMGRSSLLLHDTACMPCSWTVSTRCIYCTVYVPPPPPPPQVERALLDLCLDPSDSFLAAVGVDMGSSIAEGSVTSSLRLYEVGVVVVGRGVE